MAGFAKLPEPPVSRDGVKFLEWVRPTKDEVNDTSELCPDYPTDSPAKLRAARMAVRRYHLGLSDVKAGRGGSEQEPYDTKYWMATRKTTVAAKVKIDEEDDSKNDPLGIAAPVGTDPQTAPPPRSPRTRQEPVLCTAPSAASVDCRAAPAVKLSPRGVPAPSAVPTSRSRREVDNTPYR